ncbi:MAG: DeoR/GlpR family DNA-binding transcription regulator [Oscillospiraceae bacterium]|jgi:DeoR family myo-inositol catabolism operon transcriptional repressor|uniref:DeoR/GlpR family DNA-binding transcription regulator n=1 Tax=Oscillospiraceae TaxID=216572 RepID=UPI0024295562|nr:DeoR/GlpR transcriptional regulator [Bacillota bacterium]
MKESRRKQIESLLAERRSISMHELCEALNVSMNTVRADVSSLVREGVVEKVYGGIVLKQPEEIPLYERRSQQETDCKCRIAKMAEQLIEDGDIVFIDSGTTTMRLLDYLDPAKKITIVTANVSVLQRAQNMTNVNAMILPGLYDMRTNAMLDSSTVEYLCRFQHNKGFFGVSSLTATGGLGVSNWQEYEVKRTAAARCQKSYLLVDSTKYGRTALLAYGTLEQMQAVITDHGMPQEFIALCRQKKVTVEQV